MLIAPASMTASPGSLRRLKVSPAKAFCASTGQFWMPGGVLSASATSTCGAITNATGRSGLSTPIDSLQLLRGYPRPSMNRQKHMSGNPTYQARGITFELPVIRPQSAISVNGASYFGQREFLGEPTSAVCCNWRTPHLGQISGFTLIAAPHSWHG